jgi:hypothetical protein
LISRQCKDEHTSVVSSACRRNSTIPDRSPFFAEVPTGSLKSRRAPVDTAPLSGVKAS